MALSSMPNPSHQTTLLVPCAGFGTRAGSPPAKEMLPHPKTGRPLIDSVITLAATARWPMTLVTRAEKTELMDHINQQMAHHQLPVNWVLVESTKEWPESVLRTKSLWAEKNILILPDTQWSPQAAIFQVHEKLSTYDVCHGVFRTHDHRPWGTVRVVDQHQIQLCEKPLTHRADFCPWGLIGFRQGIGEALFQALLQSTFDHEVKTLNTCAATVELKSFEDLTRF